MLCRHYTVSGRVQGVFYRASTYDVAQQLNLTGWVRNMPDGCVEAEACGSEQQLAKFEAWLRQGPPMSLVDQIEISEQINQSDHNGFEIKYR